MVLAGAADRAYSGVPVWGYGFGFRAWGPWPTNGFATATSLRGTLESYRP